MRIGWQMVITATLLSSLHGLARGADESRDIILREADAAIEKARKGTLVIEAAPNAEVIVEQVRHEFWFGAALSSSAFGGGRMSPQDKEKYLSVFLENFNSAVGKGPTGSPPARSTSATGPRSRQRRRIATWCSSSGGRAGAAGRMRMDDAR